ncbi:lactose regulatory protein lac9 and GAL4-like protein [Nowakowskiella sp. JEL0407]|nr:lactose regulatory protein lac9 and GAL4-like protein [Nowakowskiella sp. JEL0407]
MEAQLQHCLQMLHGDDESKFAALLLIPKILQSVTDNTIVSVFLQKLYENLDFNFIARLLVPVSSDNEVPPELFQLVVVNIFSVLCTVREINETPDFVEKCFKFAFLIKSRDQTDTTSTILHIYITLSQYVHALKGLISSLTASEFCKLLAAPDGPNFPIATKLLENIQSSILQHQLELEQHSLNLKIMQDANDEFVSALLKSANLGDNLQKTYCLQLIVLILSNMEIIYHPKFDNVAAWAVDARTVLTQYIGLKKDDKINVHETHASDKLDVSLTLISILLRLFGPNWLFLEPTTATKFSKLSALIVHMTCAETRILVDSIGDIHTEPVHYFLSSNEKTDRARRILPICYEILEYTTKYLGDLEPEEGGSLPWDVIQSIRNALSETYAAVESFLIERKELYDQENSSALILDNPIAAFSVRSLCTWISEDSADSTNELKSAIPVLIPFINLNLTSMNMHAMGFIGSALVTISSDSDCREIFVAEGGVSGCEGFLRKVVMDLGMFAENQTVKIDEVLSADIVATIVGVLINIIVCDPSPSIAMEIITTAVHFILAIGQTGTFFYEKSDDRSVILLKLQLILLSLFCIRRIDSHTFARTFGLPEKSPKPAGTSVIHEFATLVVGFLTNWRSIDDEIREMWLLAYDVMTEVVQKHANLRTAVRESMGGESFEETAISQSFLRLQNALCFWIVQALAFSQSNPLFLLSSRAFTALRVFFPSVSQQMNPNSSNPPESQNLSLTEENALHDDNLGVRLDTVHPSQSTSAYFNHTDTTYNLAAIQLGIQSNLPVENIQFQLMQHLFDENLETNRQHRPPLQGPLLSIPTSHYFVSPRKRSSQNLAVLSSSDFLQPPVNTPSQLQMQLNNTLSSSNPNTTPATMKYHYSATQPSYAQSAKVNTFPATGQWLFPPSTSNSNAGASLINSIPNTPADTPFSSEEFSATDQHFPESLLNDNKPLTFLKSNDFDIPSSVFSSDQFGMIDSFHMDSTELLNIENIQDALKQAIVIPHTSKSSMSAFAADGFQTDLSMEQNESDDYFSLELIPIDVNEFPEVSKKNANPKRKRSPTPTPPSPGIVRLNYHKPKVHRPLGEFDYLPSIDEAKLFSLVDFGWTGEPAMLLPCFPMRYMKPSSSLSIFLKYAIAACASRFTRDSLLGRNCFARAQKEIFEIFRNSETNIYALEAMDNPYKDWEICHTSSFSTEKTTFHIPTNLCALVAFLYLISYCSLSSNQTSQATARNWMGLAVQVARRLRLNEELPECHPASWMEREMRRRIWWGLYIQDRIMMLTTDYIPFTSISDANIRVPVEQDIWNDDVLSTTATSPYINDVLMVLNSIEVESDWQILSNVTPTTIRLRNGGIPHKRHKLPDGLNPESFVALKPFHVRMFAMASLLERSRALSRNWALNRLEPWLDEFDEIAVENESFKSPFSYSGSSDISGTRSSLINSKTSVIYWSNRTQSQNPDVIMRSHNKANQRAAEELQHFRIQMTQWYIMDSYFHSFREEWDGVNSRLLPRNRFFFAPDSVIVGKLRDGMLRVLYFYSCHVFAHSPMWAIERIVRCAAMVYKKEQSATELKNVQDKRDLSLYSPIPLSAPNFIDASLAKMRECDEDPLVFEHAKEVLLRWASQKSAKWGGMFCERHAFNIAAWCSEILNEKVETEERQLSFLGVAGYFVYYGAVVYIISRVFRALAQEGNVVDHTEMQELVTELEKIGTFDDTVTVQEKQTFRNRYLSKDGIPYLSPKEMDTGSVGAGHFYNDHSPNDVQNSADQDSQRGRTSLHVVDTFVKTLKGMTPWEARAVEAENIRSLVAMLGLGVDY